ncbi:hypothetical protein LOZ51_003297 [Ophidiomyces ophidiicola]|nr:hypothetical protein LOZ54_004537 [Ophidiomyces ophidiicola]KAI1995471.1 hypothetical protein LOZ51_003297 [Ophidiomyces ophidiicola]
MDSLFIGHRLPLLATRISKPALLISVWVFFGVTTLLLISRFVIRICVHRRLFWDDFLAALAYALLLGHNVLATLVAPSLYSIMSGLHAGRLPINFISQVGCLAKLTFASNIIFTLCLYAVKASLLALLWRLVKNIASFRNACGLLTSEWLCNTPKHIRREAISLRFTTTADILSDLMLMSLPVAFILTSTLPLSQKLGLVGLFLLGFTVIAMSILRIAAIDNSLKAHTPPSWLLFWDAMECTIAVIVSCVAAFKSLFTYRKHASAFKKCANVSENSGSNKTGIALHSRNYFDPTPMTSGKCDTTTHITPGKARKWNDGKSREEIICSTEFEVKYEQLPIPEQPPSIRLSR